MPLTCAGNDNVHLLTSGKPQRLRIELEAVDGRNVQAEYDNFRVKSENNKYELFSVGTYKGDAGQCRMISVCTWWLKK